MAMVLHEKGYDVSTAADGYDALAHCVWRSDWLDDEAKAALATELMRERGSVILALRAECLKILDC